MLFVGWVRYMMHKWCVYWTEPHAMPDKDVNSTDVQMESNEKAQGVRQITEYNVHDRNIQFHEILRVLAWAQ